MKNFLVVANRTKDPDGVHSKRVISILEKNGCLCTAHLYTQENNTGGYFLVNPKDVPKETEAILVLGGDGTFLHVAKDLLDLKLHVAGIYFGTLGFLTEIEPEKFEEALKLITSGKYHTEERMLIEGEIFRDGKSVYKDLALNDIVLNRSSTLSLIRFTVSVNGEFLSGYSADGMIISTPTGSTGYNLSAGGPVVEPTAQIILATPVCAHTLNSRSIVFSANVEISLKVETKANERQQKKIVSFDGERDIVLEDGDIIKIKKADKSVRLIKTKDLSFIEHISKNMR